MKRLVTSQRPDWKAKVEAKGLVWHTLGDQPYWDEGTYYSFTSTQIGEIEAASAELYARFLDAGQAVIDDRDAMRIFGIPDWCHDPIRQAWNDEPPALNYGRFDFGYDGKGPPKLFEFNCDTPTSLLEASLIQWDWKQQVFPSLDQFNSLHERLVAKWLDIRSYLPGNVSISRTSPIVLARTALPPPICAIQRSRRDSRRQRSSSTTLAGTATSASSSI